MSDLLNSLRREQASLEAELRNDPRFIKVERIKALLAAYGAADDVVALAPRSPSVRQVAFSSMGGAARADSKASRARNRIREILSERSAATRNELLAMLTVEGVLGHEKAPMKQLGTYLSRFPEFQTDGAGRWRLVDQKTTEPSDDSPQDGGHQTAQQ